MPIKRCAVKGCGAKIEVFGCLCEQCYMSLCSGIVSKKTKSFLKCIPYMRNTLLAAREELGKSSIPAEQQIKELHIILANIEGDE